QGLTVQWHRRAAIPGFISAPIGHAVYAESRARKAARMAAQLQLHASLPLKQSR
ncbi:hypothetical protein LZ30DRAFT_575224, partial [Colletotrichum cereale]